MKCNGRQGSRCEARDIHGKEKEVWGNRKRVVEGQGHGEIDVSVDKHGETRTQIWGGKERSRCRETWADRDKG